MAIVIRYIVQFPNNNKIHAEINRCDDKIFRCSFFSIRESSMIKLNDSYSNEGDALDDLRRAIIAHYRAPAVGIREDARFLN